MATTKKTSPEAVGRFLVVFCAADEDGPDGWEIKGTGAESEDVLDSFDTRREAVAEAKRMEAERLADEEDERQAEAEQRRADEADAVHTAIQDVLEAIQGRADDMNGESNLEGLAALLAALRAV